MVSRLASWSAGAGDLEASGEPVGEGKSLEDCEDRCRKEQRHEVARGEPSGNERRHRERGQHQDHETASEGSTASGPS